MNPVGTLNLELIGTLLQIVQSFLTCPLIIMCRPTKKSRVVPTFSIGRVNRFNDRRIAILLESLICRWIALSLLWSLIRDSNVPLLVLTSHREQSETVLFPCGRRVIHLFACIVRKSSLCLFSDRWLLFDLLVIYILDDGDQFCLVFL